MRSRQDAFAVGAAWLTASRLAGLAVGFLVSIVAARALGREAFGAAGVAITAGTVAALLANGGVNIGVISLVGRHPERRAEVVRVTTLVALLGTMLAAIITVAGGLAGGHLLGLTGRGDLFAAAALVGGGVVVAEYLGAVLLALGRRAAYAVTDLTRGSATLVLTLLAVTLGMADVGVVLALAGGYASAAVVAGVVSMGAGVSLIPGWNGALVRSSLDVGLRGQAGNVLQFLNLRLDLLLIPALLTLPAAGLYLVAVRVSEALSQVPNAVGSLLFPAVALEADRNETELTQRAMRYSLLVVLGGTAVLAAVAEPAVVILFGPEYAAAATSLRLLALATVPLAVTRILAADLKGRGRPGLVSLVLLAGLVATVSGDVLLIPRLGIEGAAIASLAAYALTAILLLATFRATTGADLRLLVPRAADVSALWRAARTSRSAAR